MGFKHVSWLLLLCLTVDLCLAGKMHFGSFVMTKLMRKAQFHRLRRSTTSSMMESFHVLSTVTSRYSNVVVTSVVRNTASTAQQAAIVVRLPKSAFISNFSMEIEDKIYVGIVKGKQAAKQEYQQAVAQGRTAALVSATERESQTFDVSVNVEPGGVVEFQLNYQELLQRKLGAYNHMIYANPGEIVQDYKIEVQISEPSGIKTVEVQPPVPEKQRKPFDNNFSNEDLDEVTIRRSGSQAFILYQPSVEKQRSLQRTDPTFTVKYDVTREKLGGEILIRDGYFVHFFAPTTLPVIPKNVVFIIDRSGSMYGAKIEQTKLALLTILDDLADHDKFNIIVFSYESRTWQPNKMLEASKSNIEQAKAFVNLIIASGGTNLNDAALDGISLLETVTKNGTNSLEQASMMILLTDGQPTSGVTRPTQIRKNVKDENDGKYSLFCLGFGNNVDHSFLDKLARENKGLSRRIYVDSDASLQLKGFYDEVASPLLAHIIIKYKGMPVDKITTTKFDTYFKGSEILIAGMLEHRNYSNNAKSEDKGLKGVVEGRAVRGTIKLETKGKEFEETFSNNVFDMEKLWAYLTIKDLLRNKTYVAEDKTAVADIDAKVLGLSLKYNFVTPLTSMVVTKPGGNKIASDGKNRPRPSYDITSPSNFGRIVGGSRNVPKRRLFVSYFTQSLSYSTPFFTTTTRFRTTLQTTTITTTTISTTPATTALTSSATTIPTSSVTTIPSTPAATIPTSSVTTIPSTPAATMLSTVAIHETTSAATRPVPINPLLLETSCGKNVTLRSSENITSPRFPGLYPPNAQCIWRVRLSEELYDQENSKIQLTFSKLDLEESCVRDRIVVYTDYEESFPYSVENHEICGYTPNTDYLVANHSIILLFQSDDIVEGRGFLANLSVK